MIHFEQWEQDEIEVKLILKGGGCENKNIQYSLPATLERLGRADRTLEGVRKCLLHAVWQAQGQGCAPGALGVCIGSDRAHGYDIAKEQLFRTLDDVNPVPELAELEARVMKEANELGVGAMGFGGNVSLIGCKIAAAAEVAVAVDKRSPGIADSAPSPTKSPSERIAMVASLPAFETTVIFARPV